MPAGGLEGGGLMRGAQKDQNAPAGILAPSGGIFTEDQFLEALRARRDQLNISHETIDAISGLAAGHTAKLMSGHSSMGAMAMWILLQTLGLGVTLVADPVALEKLQRNANWQPRKVAPNRKRKYGNLPFVAMARRRNAPWLWSPEKAREMALKGNNKKREQTYANALKTATRRAAAYQRWLQEN
jgi:hypothetical protein